MSRQTLRRIAIPVAVVLCIAAVMWPQVRSVATILLLLVTFEYVLLTQESIELFRRQLLRQEKVYVNSNCYTRMDCLFGLQIWASPIFSWQQFMSALKT